MNTPAVTANADYQLRVPKSAAELLEDPKRVARAFEIINMFLNARVQIVPISSIGITPIQISNQGVIIPIPVQFQNSISDSTGTTASNTAQINALLAELRTVGILPSNI